MKSGAPEAPPGGRPSPAVHVAGGGVVEPFTLVLFGASGDLARRKIAPALYNLALDGFLPERVSVAGIARRPMSDDDFGHLLRQGVDDYSRRRPARDDVWRRFRFRYLAGNFNDEGTYRRLVEAVPDGNLLHYLATPPSFYAGI